MERFKKVAVLDNGTQARLLDFVLSNRAIPHIMVSYHDSACGGLRREQRGWGYVETTEHYCDEVVALLEDLKHHSAFVLTPLEEPLRTGNQVGMQL